MTAEGLPEDRRVLEYLMVNWRLSLLGIYASGGLDDRGELERAINRCSMILSALRSGEGGPRLQSLLADQLPLLASELGELSEGLEGWGEEEEEEG